MMKYFILCSGCVTKLPEEDVEAEFSAENGPRDEVIPFDHTSVLDCPPWRKEFGSDPEMKMFFCDECGLPVAVAESSDWFVKRHREFHETTS